LIDFGNSYIYNEDIKISAATPEYLPPEILNYLENLK
jgi:hypothetical protein